MTEDIKRYTGLNIADKLTDEYSRECYLANWNYMHTNFGNNVEFERMSEQVLLCEKTYDYLYTVPEPVRYVKGKRPKLEQVVNNVCRDSESDRDKVLALLCYIRDLYHKYDGEDLFYGGTEEEQIKKGEWLCERVSRLMVALCEVAGFPGRTVMHVAAGHITVEIFFEDKWGYIDPRCGLFYLDENNSFLSIYEIINNRDVIYKQTDYVKSFHSPYWSFEYRAHRNYHFCMSPYEIQCYCDYSLMDAHKYNYDWVSCKKANEASKKEHNRYIELGLMVLIR